MYQQPIYHQRRYSADCYSHNYNRGHFYSSQKLKQREKSQSNRRCSTNSSKQCMQNTNEKELENVLAIIYNFFKENPNCVDIGIKRSLLYKHILNKEKSLSLPHLREILQNAIQLKLVKIDVQKSTQTEIELLVDEILDKRESKTIVIKLNSDSSIFDLNKKSVIIKSSAMNSLKKQIEKNVKCFFCKKLFYDGHGLKQHALQSHSKAFGYAHACLRCSHKFKSAAALEWHMKDFH